MDLIQRLDALQNGGSIDASDGTKTVTITVTPHVVSSCICNNCQQIRARQGGGRPSVPSNAGRSSGVNASGRHRAGETYSAGNSSGGGPGGGCAGGSCPPRYTSNSGGTCSGGSCPPRYNSGGSGGSYSYGG